MDVNKRTVVERTLPFRRSSLWLVPLEFSVTPNCEYVTNEHSPSLTILCVKIPILSGSLNKRFCSKNLIVSFKVGI
jgi:hypothetical protein